MLETMGKTDLVMAQEEKSAQLIIIPPIVKKNTYSEAKTWTDRQADIAIVRLKITSNV